MAHLTKIARQGNSAGVRIPKEMLEESGLALGDEVTLQVSGDGIRINKADQAYNRAMELGREGAARYRRTLAKLAK
ncbi:MAG: AbrB/MazE/SpoVT family DNA-binding domain-containing protein [Desulfarculaceae bacterium]|nr:AbrB/MazE/SpoVT family DNA-binding domain-containing protein [Desulfarculaceae bacterium]